MEVFQAVAHVKRGPNPQAPAKPRLQRRVIQMVPQTATSTTDVSDADDDEFGFQPNESYIGGRQTARGEGEGEHALRCSNTNSNTSSASETRCGFEVVDVELLLS